MMVIWCNNHLYIWFLKIHIYDYVLFGEQGKQIIGWVNFLFSFLALRKLYVSLSHLLMTRYNIVFVYPSKPSSRCTIYKS